MSENRTNIQNLCIFLFPDKPFVLGVGVYMKENIKQMGFLKGVLTIFLIGFLIGVIIFICFREQISQYLEVFYNNFVSNLLEYELNYPIFLKKVIAKRVQSFLLMAIFGISVLGIFYVICFLTWKGFFLGFLLASMIFQFGVKGILLGVLYGFPHIFFYLPVMYSMMYKAYCMELNGLKKKEMWRELPVVILLLAILLIGCVLETYVNTWVLKKIFTF